MALHEHNSDHENGNTHDPSMVKIEKESNTNRTITSNENNFPFGTRLHFDDGMLEKLGMESLAVGDIVNLKGFAEVMNKSEHSDENGSNKSIALQITFIKVNREDSDRAEQLYGA